MFNLKGKTAIVAGGSGLIGKAIVKGLREQRAKVINFDYKDFANDLLCADNFPHFYTYLTMTKKEKELVTVELPPCDIFINATYPKPWKTHLTTFLQYSEDMADIMAQNGGGSIINFASIYGVLGADYRIYEGTDVDCEIEYCAVKGAIISLSRALATKYAKHGVRINCVSPGGVFDNQPVSFVKAYCNRVPLGRMATPDDIIGAVVFLASDEASYITGQNILVEGGLSAW